MESHYPKLSNAPIQEAILTVKIDDKGYETLEEVQALYSLFKSQFPHSENWGAIENKISLDKMTSEITLNEQGIKILSEDRKKILHIMPNVFTMNVIRDYMGYDAFIQLYQEQWELFIQKLQIKKLSRIGLRYINNFDVPIQNWQEYITMHPIMKQKTQYDNAMIDIREIASHYDLISKEHEANVNVIVIIKVKDSQKLNVIMDIDVVSHNSIKDYTDFKDILSRFNQLRAFKNQIFFANVPKAQEMFS